MRKWGLEEYPCLQDLKRLENLNQLHTRNTRRSPQFLGSERQIGRAHV